MTASPLFALLERIRRAGHPTPAEWAEAIDGHLPGHQADVAILVLEATLSGAGPDYAAIGSALGIHPNTARARLKAAAHALPAVLLSILNERAASHNQAAL